MTVAELLRDLANHIVVGRGDWEVDVAILKATPSEYEDLRRFGTSTEVDTQGLHKKVYIMSRERGLLKGEQ